MQNEMNKPKVIVIITEEMNSEFSSELIKSTLGAVPDSENIRLVSLSGKYIDIENDSDDGRFYKLIYNTLFRLGGCCHIDGMIIHIGDLNQQRMERIKAILPERFLHIPKVFIAANLENETSVNFDNESGIREAVDYLVNVEGLTNFCMLGGRDDNFDAVSRKEKFILCLSDNGIAFSDKNYQKTNMSEDSQKEAERLLDLNPDVQAIFCVNDAAAAGLYKAMKKRGLVPGRDVFVFGFDNTQMSGMLEPTLASIGAYECTLGQKAMELLLDKMNGRQAHSALVPTRLFGRGSCQYEMYDYTTLEMLNIDPGFIYRMFDDCMYRYQSAYIDRESVNLKRLFYEYISRMMFSLKRRYMSKEEFDSLCTMIDIFFEKGALEYTDPAKLLYCMERLQVSMNSLQKTSASVTPVNRLFARMKDRIICALSQQRVRELSAASQQRKNVQDFKIVCSVQGMPSAYNSDAVFRNIDKLGMSNAAVYMLGSPLKYERGKNMDFPEHIYLKCVVRSGKVYLLPANGREICLHEMFTRNELPIKCRGYAAFPIFYRDRLYGFMLCELTDDIYDRGEYVAAELGNAVYLSQRGRSLENTANNHEEK